jgi:hypothetical protein
MSTNTTVVGARLVLDRLNGLYWTSLLLDWDNRRRMLERAEFWCND